jgi:hypothetical protein
MDELPGSLPKMSNRRIVSRQNQTVQAHFDADLLIQLGRNGSAFGFKGARRSVSATWSCTPNTSGLRTVARQDLGIMNLLLHPRPARLLDRPWHVTAAVGATVWPAAIFWLCPGWGAAMLLLGALILVPLGLALAATPERQSMHAQLWSWVLWLQLPAAVLLVAAYALEHGLAAALLTLPWFAVTCLIALLGMLQLRLRGPLPVEELSIDLGLIYIAVGGGWAVLSRFGARLLDFSDVIVQATAVHFHYAGFVLPIMVGLAGRKFRDDWSRIPAVGVVVGVPLVAVGITLSAFGIRWPEWLAAWFLVAPCLLVAGLQFQLAIQAASWLGRGLFAISALSLAFAMVLAAVYALGSYWETNWLDIPHMLPYHGAVNALGFALPGLLAWNFPLSVPAIDDTIENDHAK